ncbi:XAC0095 family protein [Lysobacter niastensis]|uniref:XAC0095-like domain-containing protein n=1 Tax=Lysobacter niastensis TaxID=380629 RepID=A0ABS0B8Z1_9GAMM|nr:hypothetical protein [Lysobacter niastensis]MBF6025388.1 hypothetical protein [Lysobacter niastensis]
MRKETRVTHGVANGASGYLLTENAHLELLQVRDQLRLLARLTEPVASGDAAELALSPLALAHCFERLAIDLDGVIDAARWRRPSQ